MRKKINNKNGKVANLLIKQNCRCYYCNVKMNSEMNKTRYTLDHIEPYVKVGNNTDYVLACYQCNKYKGSLSKEMFEDGYVCFNIKPGFDEQSYNRGIKVRKKINWIQKTFPQWFGWNKKYINLTIKEYE